MQERNGWDCVGHIPGELTDRIKDPGSLWELGQEDDFYIIYEIKEAEAGLLYIYVAEQLRGKKLACELIKDSLKLLQKKNIKHVSLIMRADALGAQSMNGLLKKSGFER